MRVLAIDSSSPAPSLALLREDGSVKVLAAPPAAIERLARQVAGLLAESGLRVRDLQRIAVISGPGSFTGLRAGTAFARGLARGAGIPLVAIPTFEAASAALAEPADADLLLGAGRGEVHVVRRREGDLGPTLLAAVAEAGERAAREGVPCLSLDELRPSLAAEAARLASTRPAPEGPVLPRYGRASAAEERLRGVSEPEGAG